MIDFQCIYKMKPKNGKVSVIISKSNLFQGVENDQ